MNSGGSEINYDIYLNKLSDISKTEELPILLISDNAKLKNIVKDKLPDIKTYIDNQVIHTLNNNENNIKDTMLDFYLVCNCAKALSYSIYPHGSGFIQWPCVTHNIPYTIGQIIVS